KGLAHIIDGKIEAFGKDIPYAPQPTYAVCEASNGDMWIGSGSGTPNLTLYRNGQFTPHPLKTVPAAFAVVTLVCSGDTVWAGGSAGLTRLEGNNERLFTTRDGLPDDVVYWISAGTDDTLWVGTKSGFSRYRNGEFSNFGTKEGLTQSTVFSVFEDREGSLWV